MTNLEITKFEEGDDKVQSDKVQKYVTKTSF